jgi:predicted extracellular nuclease
MLKYILFSALCIGHLQAQTLQQSVESERDGKAVRFVFYNVENLFDTIMDAGIDDAEFLPNSAKAWNSVKYRLKVGNMAKVIRSTGGWQAPDLVAVCEIENRYVLQDLIRHESLKSAEYQIVHYDSNDPRGIDVGLMYSPKNLEVLHSEPIRMRVENLRTRDILYVKFLLAHVDTVHVFVNHWPSRRGGVEASEPKRMAAAHVLAEKVDSIQTSSKMAKIVIMGDFNDTPTNNSIKFLTENQNLTNLMSGLPVTSGSHKYRGVWDYLDQIIVSQPLLDENGALRLAQKKGIVFSADFLLEEDEKFGDTYPFRTWKGDFFINGFSDHLPVFIDIVYN